MMQLYGRGQSRSLRCLWALNEAELAFEYIVVSANNSDDYIRINPQSKVPALVDGDLILTESGAILNYIGRRGQRPELLPGDLRQRARYDEVCFFVMTELEQPLWTIGKHRFALPEAVRQPEIFKTAAFEFHKAQTALQQLLGDFQFAAGDGFSLADILLAQTINWAARFEMDVDGNLLDYRDRMYARPHCVQSLALVEKLG
jgi:glutathione S-transferase